MAFPSRRRDRISRDGSCFWFGWRSRWPIRPVGSLERRPRGVRMRMRLRWEDDVSEGSGQVSSVMVVLGCDLSAASSGTR